MREKTVWFVIPMEMGSEVEETVVSKLEGLKIEVDGMRGDKGQRIGHTHSLHQHYPSLLSFSIFQCT